MAMGRRQQQEQTLFIAHSDLPKTPAHPFYQTLNGVLARHGFDAFVEGLCDKFYHQKLGRPSLAPARYFRMLLLGYFEGIDSERGIAWRCGDSLSLRSFVGYALDEATVDHSTLSRTRRLIDVETHQEVFNWVLKVLAQHKLLEGKTIGVDATTLEANAAMKSIIRRDSGESYEQFLARLAQASGIATPTREDLARIDKNRPGKGSNDDWQHPQDPDARITKMKDGSTHLAHKLEHAVDMGEGACGAVVAITIQGADQGDTTTLHQTLQETYQNLNVVADDPQSAKHLHDTPVREVVMDKGYHSNQTLLNMAELEVRSYICEPDRGRRNWKDKPAERAAVYANRRRMRGSRGGRLRRRRGQFVERSFAHILETGGMRRVHLRGAVNILKRMLLQVGGFNLGLLLRKLIGKGTPRGFQGYFSLIFVLLMKLWSALANLCRLKYRNVSSKYEFGVRLCAA